MVSKPARCFYHIGGGFTLIIFLERLEKEKRKTQPLCEGGSVGSPTSTGHSPIEVNIYGQTFFLL